jgi:hypothetical protein
MVWRVPDGIVYEFIREDSYNTVLYGTSHQRESDMQQVVKGIKFHMATLVWAYTDPCTMPDDIEEYIAFIGEEQRYDFLLYLKQHIAFDTVYNRFIAEGYSTQEAHTLTAKELDNVRF